MFSHSGSVIQPPLEEYSHENIMRQERLMNNSKGTLRKHEKLERVFSHTCNLSLQQISSDRFAIEINIFEYSYIASSMKLR